MGLSQHKRAWCFHKICLGALPSMINDKKRRLRGAGLAFSSAAFLFVIISNITMENIWLSTISPQLVMLACSIVGGIISASSNEGRKALRLRLPRISEAFLSVLSTIFFIPFSILASAIALRILQQIFGDVTMTSAVFNENLSPVAMFILICIIPAITEELLFRSVLMGGLEARFPPAVAVIISGVLFGLFHMNFYQLVSPLLLGILAAYVTYRSASVISAILVHLTNNVVILWLTYVPLDTEVEQTVGGTIPVVSIFLFLIICGTLFVLAIKAFRRITSIKHVSDTSLALPYDINFDGFSNNGCSIMNSLPLLWFLPGLSITLYSHVELAIRLKLMA